MSNKIEGRFVPYEPPFKPIADDDPAVVNPTLAAGGIRVEESDHLFRCYRCQRMQLAGSKMAWISDSVRLGDPWRAIIECQRRWNGGSSGWCVPCAEKLLPRPSRPLLIRGFWSRLIAHLKGDR